MSITLFKLSGILLILFFVVPAEKVSKETPEMRAKRNLQKKGLEYLKSNPMSKELQSFIQRFKKSVPERRNKRSENKIDPNSMFVIQNGNIVPLKSVNSMFNQKRSDNTTGKSFTVLPLVVPILPSANNNNNNNDDNNINNNEVLTSQEDIVTPLVEDPNNVVDMLYETNSLLAPDITVGPNIQRFNLQPNFFKNRQVSLEDTAPSGSEELGGEQGDDTKTLHKILDDVEGLMAWKNEGLKREGVICSVNGSWISEAGGMLLEINFKPQSKNKFRVSLEEREPPLEEGFLCNGNWTIVGAVPFSHSGVLVLLATHVKDKHVATFIGECRTCEGLETVTGTWLLARSSKDCKDQKTAHKILSDAWRRENVHTLQKEHLEELQRKLDMTQQPHPT